MTIHWCIPPIKPLIQWFTKYQFLNMVNLSFCTYFILSCTQILRGVACCSIDCRNMPNISTVILLLTTTTQKHFQSQLVILILDQINKRINCAVKKDHNDTKFEIEPIPVGVISQIIHEIVNLIIYPTDEERYANHQEGFNSISPCEQKCLVYLKIITGIISLRIV